MSNLRKLNRIKLAGFKSIKEMDLEFKSLNVLIGANGSGKSNFISFFKFMNELWNSNLQLFVATHGTSESFLHFGSKKTSEINIDLTLDGVDKYEAILVPTQDNRLILKSEEANITVMKQVIVRGEAEQIKLTLTQAGAQETGLSGSGYAPAQRRAAEFTRSWKIYHFHDTSETAIIKKVGKIDDNLRLHPQGNNLAAFLYSIKETPEYKNIVQTIQRIAPYFHDFDLHPRTNDVETIRLEWKHTRNLDFYFDANSLSDGTLRFMCLATLLLQPKLPSLILLDEPELGLHPYALHLLGAMLRSVSSKTQIVISTQSVTLANQFSWEDLIVVEQKDGASSFQRLKEDDVKIWLDDYRIGDLWEKNIIGGNP